MRRFAAAARPRAGDARPTDVQARVTSESPIYALSAIISVTISSASRCFTCSSRWQAAR
jgi:hypothetical protein